MFEAIARPFGMLLMFLYDLVQNYALALVLVAVVVRIVLLPFQMKGKRGMLRQTRLQPKISELQKRHAANKQKLNEEMGKLYKEEGINPASGCLWNFIQMPIMIALIYAIRQPLTLMMGVARDLLARNENGADGEILQVLSNAGVDINSPTFEGFYSEIYVAQEVTANWASFEPLNIEHLQPISFNLGVVNLTEIPSWQVWTFPWGNFTELLPVLLLFLLPLFSGGMQFLSAGIMRKMNAAGSPEAAGGTMGTVMKFMPLLSVWFGFMFPAALSLYWTTGTVLQAGQDIWLTKKYTKILDAEDAEKAIVRKAKEAELEAKRLETERKKAEGLVEQNKNTSKRKKQKSEKQDQLQKAAEWEKKNAPEPAEEKHEPSRVENRRFARGRAYDPDRFDRVEDDLKENDDSETDSADEAADVDTNFDSTEENFEDGDTDFEDDDFEDEDEDEYGYDDAVAEESDNSDFDVDYNSENGGNK